MNKWEQNFSISMNVPDVSSLSDKENSFLDTIVSKKSKKIKKSKQVKKKNEIEKEKAAIYKEFNNDEEDPLTNSTSTTKLINKLREKLIKGDSDDAIMASMRLKRREYKRLKTKMYEQAIDGLADKTPEQQYVDYCIEQQRCLDDLDDMIKEFKDTRQYNAMVGAIRAKSQIIGDIHKTGTTMGMVKHGASYDKEGSSVRIRDLNNKELRESVASGLRSLKGIIEQFGDKPMDEIGIDPRLTDPTINHKKQGKIKKVD